MQPYNHFTSHWFKSCNVRQTEILLVRLRRGTRSVLIQAKLQRSGKARKENHIKQKIIAAGLRIGFLDSLNYICISSPGAFY